MIILNSTTDKIQIDLAGAVTTNQLPCFASYRDTTSTTIEAKRNALNTNNTTAVDLVGSPAASTQRVVDYISVYNRDTAAATVSVVFNDNGTSYNLCVVVLAAGERLEYQEGEGFRVMTTTAATAISENAGVPSVSSSITFVLLGADVPRTGATTFADITGLSFAVTAGKTYWFRFTIAYTSSATSVGARFAVNGPASPTLLYYYSDVTFTTTSKFYTRGNTTYDSGTVATTTAATTGNIAIVEGVITPSASGTFIGRLASETAAGTITAKAGSCLQYMEI